MFLIIITGIIKLFGSICCQYPKSINNQYRNFALMILNNINDNNQSILSISVETLGVMATTVEGKLALSKLGTWCRYYVNSYIMHRISSHSIYFSINTHRI